MKECKRSYVPAISIVIPYYNLDSCYLDQAIKSIIEQKNKSFEILLIDDGSDLPYAEKYAEYAGNVKLIRTEHKGVSHARNEGIKQACGKYIVFLDADDFLGDDFLKTGLDVLEKNKEIGWVYGKSIIQSKAGLIQKVLPVAALSSNNIILEGDIFGTLLRGNLMCIQSVMVRRSVVENNLFDETLRGFEDWDLWLRIAANHSIKYIGKMKSYTVMRQDSAQRNVTQFASDKIKVIQKIQRLFPDKTKLFKTVCLKNIAKCFNVIGLHYYKEKDYKKSFFNFLKSLFHYSFQLRPYRYIPLCFIKGLMMLCSNVRLGK